MALERKGRGPVPAASELKLPRRPELPESFLRRNPEMIQWQREFEQFWFDLQRVLQRERDEINAAIENIENA